MSEEIVKVPALQREVEAFRRRDATKALEVRIVADEARYFTGALRDYLEEVGDTPENREQFIPVILHILGLSGTILSVKRKYFHVPDNSARKT